ncbi:MAG: LamG domain-containing protein, partial [Candidatus Paceibacterota bacterium]
SNLSLAPLDYGDASLVGYWPLNEGTGTIAYDRSGKGNNGTLVNGPTWTSRGVSAALSFDGLTSRVGVNNITSSQTMTVSLWFNPADVSTSTTVIYKNDGGYSFMLYRNNFWTPGLFSWLRYCDCPPANNCNSLTSYYFYTIPGTWYQTSFITIADGSFKMYVNGSQVLSSAATNFSSWRAITSAIALGNGNSPFAGLIDDVRIYNRALSASEISALYNATK